MGSIIILICVIDTYHLVFDIQLIFKYYYNNFDDKLYNQVLLKMHTIHKRT